MDLPTYHVPFTIPSIGMGLQAMSGIIHAQGDTLRIEYEVKDGLVGLFRSGPKELSLPVARLAGVSFRRSLLRAKLEIRTRSLKDLAGIPGSEAGSILLNINRRDRSMAERLASTVSLRISEYNLSISEDRLSSDL